MGLRRLLSTSATLFLAGQEAAWAQTAYGGDGALGPALQALLDRLEHVFAHLPDLGTYLARLPRQFDLATVGLLAGIVVAGLTAENLTRRLLHKMRHGVIARHAGDSPLRAFLHAVLLDALALLALWIAARFVAGQVGNPQGLQGQIAQHTLLALLYWRGFNFIFRAWLRPNTPQGRIAPVDDVTAARLLAGLNVVIVLPLLARYLFMILMTTAAGPEATSAAVILYVPFIAGGLLWAVWHWRHDMTAWLTGLVGENGAFRGLKLGLARDWWMGGLAFYAFTGAAAILATLTARNAATRGLNTLESMVFLLLLGETLISRITRHLPLEVPTIGDVVAGCVQLALRLLVVVVAAEALMVNTLGIIAPAAWGPHDRALKVAALSAFAAYALWRVLKYRMDRYIADNPLPQAGFGGDAEDDAPAAASRLRTIMPVLKGTAGITILILGGLLVLSELGINITPLIAGASVLGLAVSFGSQSLVRDIVSGVFFLADDSFRVGEYIDTSRVKGTVEGFTVRSIRLRHQNGQLHIVPFGQLVHVTNFSRDWTTVKFNLAFALNTDVELLRKTTKKIGLEMMTEPQFQKELLQPLKMQGLVDIKDASLIVRFKFTSRPLNPSLIQRTAIRRLFETLPKLGIEFARPPFAALAGLGGLDPAARAAAQ